MQNIFINIELQKVSIIAFFYVKKKEGMQTKLFIIGYNFL